LKCVNGTYSNYSGSFSCYNCSAGKYPNKDKTKCNLCPAGTYSNEGD
jgi:hypothetical protein